MTEKEKLGYLTEEYKVFYLADTTLNETLYHYHEFDKIIFFLSGDVEYTIEGKTYLCSKKDFIFVPSGTLHKVKNSKNQLYRRIVIYLDPDFLRGETHADLRKCFHETRNTGSSVLHFTEEITSQLQSLLVQFREESNKKQFGANLLLRTVIYQFMIQINRAVLHEEVIYLPKLHENNKISMIFDYIHQNLKGDLSAEKIADSLFLSKSYLMHLFKEETGETLASYITAKRLSYARELILKGVPVTQACYECGYKEYSTFLRAYRKKYTETPKALWKKSED